MSRIVHPARREPDPVVRPVLHKASANWAAGRATDDDTIATLVELVRKLGKVPVVVADSPGFLVNRILFPYLDEGVRLAIETGRGQAVDAEAERFGMPMGPLELLDLSEGFLPHFGMDERPGPEPGPPFRSRCDRPRRSW